MIKTRIVGIALAMFIVPGLASAADLTPVAPMQTDGPDFNWMGLYIGINGGGGWGRSRQDQLAAPNLTTGDFTVSGAVAEGTVGYNLQVDHVVIGLEGDLDWANIAGTVSCPTAGFSCTTSTDYLGTVRARVGYAWYRFLPYFTAGGAIGDIKQGFAPAIATNNGILANRIGWTIGGGVEAAFSYQWSVKLEYLHVDLGTFSCSVACSGAAAQTINTTLSEDIVRGGINFRF